MKSMRLLLAFVGAGLAACSPNDVGDSAVDSEIADPSYVVMGEDLRQLKDDFNVNEGRVRLLFISGPTCGICLRGMADLNDAFIAASQGDSRLVTFVAHVPALGAREEHVAATIPLLQGPRIHHYWEDSGIIGQHFSEVMDVEIYVWDFWMIYGPEARWDGVLPPAPDYYEHQLGVTSGGSRGFPRERVLDADRFAAEAAGYVARVDAEQFIEPEIPILDKSEQLADGTVILVVAQPRNVAVRQHIMGRGGYKNLKRIQAIYAEGLIETDSASYQLVLDAARPNSLRRILELLQTESGINASEIGEKIGLSQSAVWRRIQSLREEGVIREQPVKLDREKVGLNTMVFAHVKLTSHGRSNLADFSEAVRKYPEVLDCYVLLGNVDFLLRIVTEDIKAYEQFFFEKLSQLPGIQEVNSSIVLSDIKHTTVLPI